MILKSASVFLKGQGYLKLHAPLIMWWYAILMWKVGQQRQLSQFSKGYQEEETLRGSWWTVRQPFGICPKVSMRLYSSTSAFSCERETSLQLLFLGSVQLCSNGCEHSTDLPTQEQQCIYFHWYGKPQAFETFPRSRVICFASCLPQGLVARRQVMFLTYSPVMFCDLTFWKHFSHSRIYIYIYSIWIYHVN